MDDFQEKLGSILANPQLMGQIMNMAQSMGRSQPPPMQNPPRQQSPEQAMLKALMSRPQAAQNKQQQNLLAALRPFLAAEKFSRLERALQAAQLAQMATAMLSQMNSPPGGKQVNHV